MSKVVTFAQQKGGCGKSTLAVNTAVAAQQRGIKVCIYEGDPDQASATDWAAQRAEAGLPAMPIYQPEEGPAKDLKLLRDHYDLVIADTPGSDENGYMWQTMWASDVVYLPIEPAVFSIKRIDYMMAYLRRGPSCRAHLLLNRVNPNPKRLKWCVLQDKLKADPEVMALCPPSEVIVHSLVAFEDTLDTGKSVMELTPSGPAAEIMNRLLEEILK